MVHVKPGTGVQPSDLPVAQLIERFPELTAGGNYHLDASHLSSTMRYARLSTDPALVASASREEQAEEGTHRHH